MASTGWTYDGTAGNVGNDQGSNNSSGFTALPSGYRNSGNGVFNNINVNVFWWSSTDVSANAYYYLLAHNEGGANRGDSNKSSGMSVRCVKD